MDEPIAEKGPDSRSQLKSSRIFVRNLPVTRFTEKELREHFSKFSEITDCRYYPKRHIAFIGFRNADDAENAANYFDKSYIRTSKLGVEVAKSLKDGPMFTRDAGASSTGNGKRSSATSDGQKQEAAKKSLKRKREHGDAADDNSTKPLESDPRFKEYMALSQHSTKLKTWENDLRAGDDVEMTTAHTGALEPTEDGSDDEYDNIPKKLGQSPPGAMQKMNSAVESDQLPLPQPGRSVEDDQDEAMANSNEASDSDWLRSRQNRTLDLDLADEDTEWPAEERAGEVIPEIGEAIPDTDTHGPLITSEDAEMEEAGAEPDSEKKAAIEEILKTGRLFVRNLYYSCTEDDLRGLFENFGELEEVHIPVDSKTSKSKGIAFILFRKASDAVDAFDALDKDIFQGRSLHILPGKPRKSEKLDDFELAKLPLKKQREILKKRQAAKAEFEWNSLYMNIDSVIASTAKGLGISKAEVLDPTSSDAVVRQAQAETQIIQETKAYFEAQGVNLAAFSMQERGDSVLLIKNFPFGTTAEELKVLLAAHGDVRRVMMPPAGTIAIAEFANGPSGRAALTSLYGRKFKDSVLKLEKGPKELFAKETKPQESGPDAAKNAKASGHDFLQVSMEDFPDTTSLYIKNLNFSTRSNDLRDVFEPLDGFLSARVQTKPGSKTPGTTLSQGYGFVEFKTKADADAAQKAMNGFALHGYKLSIQPARRDDDTERRGGENKKSAQKKTKIIIKNLAFEVTEKQVRSLFSQYGKLRSVRLPKKFNRSTRGFGFADFINAGDASNAMDALKHTHLHGRPLVLEWAKEDSKNAEEEIQRLTKKASKQVNAMNMAQLTGSATRKKSDIKKLVEGVNDDEL